MDLNNLRKQHIIRIEHMKLQTLAFNMFRNINLNNSEYFAFIEPLYYLQHRYLHRPDILIVEKRSKKVYFHWIEVKSGESKKFWKEIPKNIKSLNKYFYSEIFPYLTATYPKIRETVSKSYINNIKQDYSVFIKAIYSDGIPTDADFTIFVGAFEEGKVRALTSDTKQDEHWTFKFFKRIKKMNNLNIPTIFTPSYIFSLLFTDAVRLFYPDIFKAEKYFDVLKAQRNLDPAKYNLTKYMIKNYNYPPFLADFYSYETITMFKKYKIFKINKRKEIKINNNENIKVKYPILIKKLEKGLKDPYIQTEALILDHLVNNKIPVLEIYSKKKTLMDYLFS